MGDFSNLSTQQHAIPLVDAAAMTLRYRENKTLILQPQYPPEILALCETFNKDGIVALANNPLAVGIRIYYGMDENLSVHAILVGVDAQGADILPPAAAGSAARRAADDDDDGDDDILEDGIRCPPTCPPGSPLNGG
ncbi:MAG TPA: hypothetical protein VGM41_09665 [Chitinophagaceae bacterium]